jgi:hypothetical protein
VQKFDGGFEKVSQGAVGSQSIQKKKWFVLVEFYL